MQLRNETPFDALVHVAAPKGDQVAVVIVKSTFDLDEIGRGTPAAEQMPIVPQPVETVYGIFHGEVFFRKQGVDLCVLGTVRRRHPVRSTSVSLMLGSTRRWTLGVHGERRWQRSHHLRGRLLVPSHPTPFTEMPLGFDRAFGGNRQFLDGKVALFPDNPSGRGFFMTEDQAQDQALPNIERSDARPLASWSDTTAVAGWGPYPSFWGLRAASSVVVDPTTSKVRRVLPSLFNHAHPDLVLERPPIGETVRIEGLHEQPIQIRVPPEPARVRAQVGAYWVEVPAPVDGVFLWCDDRKLVVTQRGRFTYQFHPEEHREVFVLPNLERWS